MPPQCPIVSDDRTLQGMKINKQISLEEQKQYTKIVGGIESDINRHPWLVSMTYISKDMVAGGDEEPKGMCGGVIIDEHHILTSKDCCSGQGPFNSRDILKGFGGLDTIVIHFGVEGHGSEFGGGFEYWEPA